MKLSEMKVKKVEIVHLSPPKPIKPTPTKEAMLDFNKIANSSDFQRFVVYLMKQTVPGLFTKVSTRVPAEKMIKQFNSTRADYKLVMNELKEKLAKRKAKIEELN